MKNQLERLIFFSICFLMFICSFLSLAEIAFFGGTEVEHYLNLIVFFIAFLLALTSGQCYFKGLNNIEELLKPEIIEGNS